MEMHRVPRADRVSPISDSEDCIPTVMEEGSHSTRTILSVRDVKKIRWRRPTAQRAGASLFALSARQLPKQARALVASRPQATLI